MIVKLYITVEFDDWMFLFITKSARFYFHILGIYNHMNFEFSKRFVPYLSQGIWFDFKKGVVILFFI